MKVLAAGTTAARALEAPEIIGRSFVWSLIYRPGWNIYHDAAQRHRRGLKRSASVKGLGLDRVVFFRFAGTRNRQPEVPEFQAQSLSSYP